MVLIDISEKANEKGWKLTLIKGTSVILPRQIKSKGPHL